MAFDCKKTTYQDDVLSNDEEVLRKLTDQAKDGLSSAKSSLDKGLADANTVLSELNKKS